MRILKKLQLLRERLKSMSSSDKAEKGRPIVLKPNQKAVFVKSDNEFRTNDTDIARSGN